MNPTAPCFCGYEHAADERFFVTMDMKQGPQLVAVLLGPYATHAEAHRMMTIGHKLVTAKAPWIEERCLVSVSSATDPHSISAFASAAARCPWNAVTGDPVPDIATHLQTLLSVTSIRPPAVSDEDR